MVDVTPFPRFPNGRPPPLTDEQNRLVESCMGLCVHLANKMSRFMGREDTRDMKAAGFMALVRAARGFDAEKPSPKTGLPVKFGTYCYRAVLHAILQCREELLRRGMKEVPGGRPAPVTSMPKTYWSDRKALWIEFDPVDPRSREAEPGAEAKERARALWRLLNIVRSRVSVKAWFVFEMTHVSEVRMSYREAAGAAKVSRSRAGQYVIKVRRLLEKLKGEDEGAELFRVLDVS